MRTPYWARPISVHPTRGARYGARRVLSFAPLSIVVVPVVVLSRVSVRGFGRMFLPVVIALFLVVSAVAVLVRIFWRSVWTRRPPFVEGSDVPPDVRRNDAVWPSFVEPDQSVFLDRFRA